MYNIAISAGAALISFLLVTLIAGFHYWWGGLLAALPGKRPCCQVWHRGGFSCLCAKPPFPPLPSEPPTKDESDSQHPESAAALPRPA